MLIYTIEGQYATCVLIFKLFHIYKFLKTYTFF